MQPIIKHERVRFEAVEPHAALPASPAAAPGSARPLATAARSQPALRLARVEGELRAIELSCGCGAQHVIELEYEGRAGGAANAQEPHA